MTFSQWYEKYFVRATPEEVWNAALEECLGMFKDMTKQYKNADDALWQIEQRITALKEKP